MLANMVFNGVKTSIHFPKNYFPRYSGDKKYHDRLMKKNPARKAKARKYGDSYFITDERLTIEVYHAFNYLDAPTPAREQHVIDLYRKAHSSGDPRSAADLRKCWNSLSGDHKKFKASIPTVTYKSLMFMP